MGGADIGVLNERVDIGMVDIRHRHRAVESTLQIPGTC